MTLLEALLVGFLGGVGACLRWACTRWLTRAGRSYVDRGLLLANAVGSLALGVILGAGFIDGRIGMAFALGFCGALTTWSSPMVAAVSGGALSDTDPPIQLRDLSVQIVVSLATFALGYFLLLSGLGVPAQES